MLKLIQEIIYNVTGKSNITDDTDFVKDLELNSFDVTEESIIHGVVIISSRSTKNLVAPLGMILALFTANPAAIIKKIDVIFESIITMESL